MGVMWAKLLRAFQVGKARTSQDGPSSRILASQVASAPESWPYTNRDAEHTIVIDADGARIRTMPSGRPRPNGRGASSPPSNPTVPAST